LAWIKFLGRIGQLIFSACCHWLPYEECDKIARIPFIGYRVHFASDGMDVSRGGFSGYYKRGGLFLALNVLACSGSSLFLSLLLSALT
jgi:hypothetical protein